MEEFLRTRRTGVPDDVALDRNAMEVGAVGKGGKSRGTGGKAKGKGTKDSFEKGGKSGWEKGRGQKGLGGRTPEDRNTGQAKVWTAQGKIHS